MAQENISNKIGLILSVSLILIWGARLPVVCILESPLQMFGDSILLKVRIGRIAGQYAKPRSSAMEKIGDREVLSFRYSRSFSNHALYLNVHLAVTT